MQNQDVVNNLILFVRNYDGLNKEITSVGVVPAGCGWVGKGKATDGLKPKG
jgi:hypothetical protein